MENEPSKEANVKFDDLDVDAALKKEGMVPFLLIFTILFYISIHHFIKFLSIFAYFISFYVFLDEHMAETGQEIKDDNMFKQSEDTISRFSFYLYLFCFCGVLFD